jgi:hypothetical protein
MTPGYTVMSGANRARSGFTAQRIAGLREERALRLDRRYVLMPRPIRDEGKDITCHKRSTDHTARIRLHPRNRPGVTASPDGDRPGKRQRDAAVTP